MSVTVDLVKKLILQYIGGKPVLGNAKKVLVNDKLVVIQAAHLGPLGSLTGELGNLVNQATSSISAIQQLVQNPLAAVSGQISSLTGNLLSQVQSIAGLPSDALSQISGSISTLQTSTQNFLDHTNILSGVIQDVETIGTSAITPGELMNVVDSSDVQQMAGSLFADGTLNTIQNSLDPAIPGGVTDLVTSLQNTTDTAGQTQIAGLLSKALTDHSTEIDSVVQSDQTAISNYFLKNDIVNATQNLIPAQTNDAQSVLFDRIATPTLKNIVSEIPDDVRTSSDVTSVTQTDSYNTNAPVSEVPPHIHRTSDIVGLMNVIHRPLSIFWTSPPGSSETLGIFSICQSLTIDPNFGGSTAYVGTPPLSDYVLTISQNSATIGTVTIKSDSSVTWATTTGTDTIYLFSGDYISIAAPVVVDSAISNVALTIKAMVIDKY